MMSELWPHQVSALDRLKNAVAWGRRRPLVAAPTGAGKTLLAAAIVEGALRKGKRVIFTVPALALVDQTIEAFWDEGIRDVGVIQGMHAMTDWGRPVQVASVQTLMRRRIPEADVVVIDEAHRWFDFYGRWMGDEGWANTPMIGLSATPWTRGLGRWYDELIIAATTEELIEKGFLSPFRVFAPAHPDLSGVRTVAGDYHEGDLSKAMDKSPLVADAVTTWLRLAEWRPTLCFAVDRAHAKHLQGQFEAAGVSAGYIDAFTPSAERKEIAEKFSRGAIRVVCSVGCLTTGVDWDVRCIVLARPTKSEMLYVQMIGRGLRKADGKADCLILDHSDTTLRLGFVTDIHHEELDDGKRKSVEASAAKPALPKACPQCSYLKPPKVHICPACGHKPERKSEIEVEDGELAEMKPKASRATQAEKQRWYSMLIAECERRGYRSGWAANAYRKKFGVWPRGLSELSMPADPEVLGYIRHLQIRYAKSAARVAA